MQLELTKLMYRTFQHCRYVLADTPDWLHALATVLAPPVGHVTNHVALPHHARVRIAQYGIHDMRVSWITALRPSRPFPQTAQPFITLAMLGTADLQRLWAAHHFQAVRALGYAFHNLPTFLLMPSNFEPAAYVYCIRSVGRYWGDLSPRLQHQLCTIMDYTTDDIQRVLTQPTTQLDG